MAGVSCAIDWGSIDDDDTLDVVVVPSSASPPAAAAAAAAATTTSTPTPTYAKTPELAAMSDQNLKDKIRRLRGFLKGPASLKDGGDKLKISLAQCEDELCRRATTPLRKIDVAREKTSCSYSDSTRRESLNRCSDGYSFKKSYEPLAVNTFYGKVKMVENVTRFGALIHPIMIANDRCDAVEKKTKVAFEDDFYRLRQDKCNTEKGKKFQASREPHFKSFSDKARRRDKVKDKKSSRKVTSRSVTDRIRSRVHSNGRKVPEPEDPLDYDMEKVTDMVLLDDDDIETAEQAPRKEFPDKWKENKMYYPSRNDPEAIELDYSDIKCLQPCEYLSSPVMNFYIQFLKQSLCQTSRSLHSFYIYNTYFYQKLEEAFDSKGEQNSLFTKLRRWWKGVNIFEKAYIILPIHGRLHWSLVIVCIPENQSQSGPIILHLDSLGCHSSSIIFNTIERYLKKEWLHAAQNNPQISLHQIQKEKVLVPQQKNEYDCGLFVLYFIERFITDAPDRFADDDLAMFGRKWFKPEEASSLRQKIRRLLLDELEMVQMEDGTKDLETVSCSSDSDKLEDGTKDLETVSCSSDSDKMEDETKNMEAVACSSDSDSHLGSSRSLSF